MLFIDGFSHLREMDHEADEDEDRQKMIKLLHSETDDEGDKNDKDGKEDAKEKEKEEKPEEPPGPTEWSCPLCTFLNAMDVGTCVCCEAGKRPSREELDRAFKQAI